MRSLLLLTIALVLSLAAVSAQARGLGVPHEKQPLDDLTVGGQPSKADLERARDRGYPTVISLRRARGLLAIERYLLHGMSKSDAVDLAAAAHMEHATGDVKDWIRSNGR